MEKYQLIGRLKKVEGQLRGIQRMVEEDRNYIEVLHQIAAVQGATENVAVAIIENYTRNCIKNIIIEGNENKEVQELIKVMKLLKKN